MKIVCQKHKNTHLFYLHRLIASKEQPLSKFGKFSVQISKLPNTMATCNGIGIIANGYEKRGAIMSNEELDDENFLRHGSKVDPPRKKRGRQKKTVPKPRDFEDACNDMDVNMEAAALGPARDCETPDGSLLSVCEEDEEELDVQDFRRFSSRVRKSTNFFGVMGKNDQSVRGSGRGGRGGRRRVSAARRMLRFDSSPDLLMITPPQLIRKV